MGAAPVSQRLETVCARQARWAGPAMRVSYTWHIQAYFLIINRYLMWAAHVESCLCYSECKSDHVSFVSHYQDQPGPQ